MNYAELNENGIVSTVKQVTDPIQNSRHVEISMLRMDYLGCRWDGARFEKMMVTASKEVLQVNETATITMRLLDADTGELIETDDTVTIMCGETAETVSMTGGQGQTNFASEVSGRFIVAAITADGTTGTIQMEVK